MTFKGSLPRFTRIYEFECSSCGSVVLDKSSENGSLVIANHLEAAE